MMALLAACEAAADAYFSSVDYLKKDFKMTEDDIKQQLKIVKQSFGDFLSIPSTFGLSGDSALQTKKFSYAGDRDLAFRPSYRTGRHSSQTRNYLERSKTAVARASKRASERFIPFIDKGNISYYKESGDDVELKLDYDNLLSYDKVFISKVFTDTPIDESVLKLPNAEWGGTGFYFDKSPDLPYEIEHHMPDYHLYDDWVNEQVANGRKRSEFKEYLDYSIAYISRGCFRKCPFCVNQKYDRVFEHSPLEEFYDQSRKKICLLDDNFFGCPNWKELLQQLKDTGKPFKFKQGLDERLLTDEKCEMLFSSKYDGDITFAFDNIEDYELIERKLKMIRNHTDKQCVFYVLCGFDREGKYDK